MDQLITAIINCYNLYQQSINIYIAANQQKNETFCRLNDYVSTSSGICGGVVYTACNVGCVICLFDLMLDSNVKLEKQSNSQIR